MKKEVAESPTYAQVLYRHLTAYKASRLVVKDAGACVHKGREVHCGHILPREPRWLNILVPIRTEVRE